VKTGRTQILDVGRKLEKRIRLARTQGAAQVHYSQPFHMIMVVAFSIEVIRRKGPRNRLDTRLRRVFNVVL
jgi:hypothetical protein